MSKQLKSFSFIQKKGEKLPDIKINTIPIDKIWEHNTKIKEKSTKFLGFKIDDTLSFKDQINKINNKASKRCLLNSNTKKTQSLEKQNCLYVYHSLIASYIQYGLAVRGKDHNFRNNPKNIIEAKYNSHTNPTYD